MKIAIIGLGDIAQKAYLPIITQMAGIELVFCTRNAQTLSALAQQYRVSQTCADYKDVIKFKVDAVMIHAATAIHPKIAEFFLAQGIPTFVDKPLADSASSCEQLYDIAEKHQQPLYVGFNRRHIPLYNQHLGDNTQLGSNDNLLALHWQKNRHNQPGDIRTFIFDDFIHPLDSINLNAVSDIDNADIRFQMQGDQLSRLDIQWQQGNTLLCASMDRLFGVTNETVTARFSNTSYQFNSFTAGTEYSNNQEQQLTLKDWTPMLTSKGFEAMLRDWFSVIEQGALAPQIIERNLASHQLADALCRHVEKRIGR